MVIIIIARVTAVLAAICGVTIRDFERGAHASVAFGGTGMVTS